MDHEEEQNKDNENKKHSQTYWEAVENNSIELVKKFIQENKVKVNDYDEYGNTALHYASKNGYLEMVDILLENGAEINAEGENRLTPLHLSLSQ